MQSCYGSCRKKGSFTRVIEYSQEQGANTNKIVSKCVPKRAGEKSHQKKPRKGKSNIRTEPITTLNTVDINTLTDPELMLKNSWNFVNIGTMKKNFTCTG